MTKKKRTNFLINQEKETRTQEEKPKSRKQFCNKKAQK